MKKMLFLLYLFALLAGKTEAAPYNLDAPIEFYTWGESMKTVMESREDNDSWQKVSDDMILLFRDDSSAFFLRFWDDKLVRISKSYSSTKMTAEQKDTLYNRHLDDFTPRWGKPDPARPCPDNPAVCAQVTWNANAVTQVSLYRSTQEADRSFVGYSYQSRELMPKYQQEIKTYGIKLPVEHLITLFRDKPEYAQKTLKGKRVRIEALVAAASSPLQLEYREYMINAGLRNSKAAKSLAPGQIVTVSGVVEGIKGDTLLLSDTFFVPSPEGKTITINRAGKKPKGFFPAETFNSRLEIAASQSKKKIFIRSYLSRSRLEDERVIVDLFPYEFPGGMSFSLESLKADRSSDTIIFSMNLKEEQQEPHGYFVMIAIGMILKASQPDESLDKMWSKIEGILEASGKTVINGWTYQCSIRDDRHITFSATAPQRYK